MCVLCTTPSLYSDTKEPFVPADLTKKTAIDQKKFLKNAIDKNTIICWKPGADSASSFMYRLSGSKPCSRRINSPGSGFFLQLVPHCRCEDKKKKKKPPSLTAFFLLQCFWCESLSSAAICVGYLLVSTTGVCICWQDTVKVNEIYKYIYIFKNI